jgi:cation transport ATPase
MRQSFNFISCACKGESMPVAKGVGQEVLCGTVNKEGLLHVKATRVGSDTTLAAITRLVTESQVRGLIFAHGLLMLLMIKF